MRTSTRKPSGATATVLRWRFDIEFNEDRRQCATGGVRRSCRGVDISPQIPGCAKEFAAQLPRAEFVVGDNEQPPFPTVALGGAFGAHCASR
jgi:hypothetical protein